MAFDDADELSAAKRFYSRFGNASLARFRKGSIPASFLADFA